MVSEYESESANEVPGKKERKKLENRVLLYEVWGLSVAPATQSGHEGFAENQERPRFQVLVLLQFVCRMDKQDRYRMRRTWERDTAATAAAELGQQEDRRQKKGKKEQKRKWN